MLGKHLRKVEARAARWAERFEDESYPRPPREVLARALRSHAWMGVRKVDGSLETADDLIRVVKVDVPELVAEIRRLRTKEGV